MRLDEVTESDRLIGIDTPVARDAALMVDGSAGPVDLLIPAGSELVLEESGTHIRLLGLEHPLEPARSFPLRLQFEKSGVVLTRLTVESETLFRRFK
jgi:copper(I)-binding protein